jgi:hypothetical protein
VTSLVSFRNACEGDIYQLSYILPYIYMPSSGQPPYSLKQLCCLSVNLVDKSGNTLQPEVRCTAQSRPGKSPKEPWSVGEQVSIERQPLGSLCLSSSEPLY